MSDDSTPHVHVTSHNQSGGITAHTVNIGRLRFDLTDEVKQAIANLLDRGISVTIYSAQSSRSDRFAEELRSYLTQQGFSIGGMISGSIPLPLDEPITIFHGGYHGDGITIAGGQQLIAIDAAL